MLRLGRVITKILLKPLACACIRAMIDDAYFPIVISAVLAIWGTERGQLHQRSVHPCRSFNLKRGSPCNVQMSDRRHRMFLAVVSFAAIRVTITKG